MTLSATTLPGAAFSISPAGGSMPLGRLIHAYVTEAKYESLRLLRTLAFALPILILPLIVYVMFGILMTRDVVAKTPSVANLMFCGYSIFAVMGPALFSMGVSLAIERDAGLMKLKRALPAPPGAYLLAKMLTALFFAVMAVTIMTTVGLVMGKVTLTPVQIALVDIVLVVGALPFCAIGMFIGAHVSGGAAPAVANLVFLPMTWFSGLFFPPPAFLKPFVVIFPAYHLDQLALAAAGLKQFQAGNPLISLAVLVGVTVVFGGLAIRKLALKG